MPPGSIHSTLTCAPAPTRQALLPTRHADGAGIIDAIGAGVSGLTVGARVFFSGTATHKAYGAYAQKVLCEPQQVHPLPDRLSFAQGAGVGVPYVTAWRALHDRARLQPGETLLSMAPAAASAVATQIARAWGATVWHGEHEGRPRRGQTAGRTPRVEPQDPATWMR